MGAEELNNVRIEGCEMEDVGIGSDLLPLTRERVLDRAAVLEIMRHRIEVGHLRRGVNIMRSLLKEVVFCGRCFDDLGAILSLQSPRIKVGR